ncbi:uncharacterized protein LOC126833363 [Adelges cooleyi]|uniref:uncharacterized protein LOC126833363 n=1 Tax=Adelges cooleyi TaxID=133065 RepID=UPI00217F7470|nr:uncharacterized protein LOC126833363 [Adelges cooleyi]
MIFYWVLISYAYVDVMAHVNLLEYTDLVDMTNELIECACYTFFPNKFHSGFGIAIKTIVRGNQYTFDEMNYMLAIPDYADYTNLEAFKGYQTRMQTEIINATGLRHVPANGGQDITSLGNFRRTWTKETIRRLFDIDLFHGDDSNYTDDQKCYLIGIAIQSNYVSGYTVSAEMKNGFCVIMDTHGCGRKYKEIGNQFWQVHWTQTNLRIGTLLDQLKFIIAP